MIADQIRATLEFLVLQRLGYAAGGGKHLYLLMGGPLAIWPHLQAGQCGGDQGCFWWISKSSDKSTEPAGKKAGLVHVVDHGAEIVSMATGPVLGAMTDTALGLVGVPAGTGMLVETAVHIGMDLYQGRGLGDTVETPWKRDLRYEAKGTSVWEDVAFEQDFLCGGVAMLFPKVQPPGLLISMQIWNGKNDYLSHLGVAEKKGSILAARPVVETYVTDYGWHFFITAANQMVDVTHNYR